MALDKNDGIFLPSIDGVVSGKTSQVDGMNGIMNNLIGNDNYLEDKKLDRGNYVGSGELLRKDDNGIWGGEYGGKIQDPIPKELNKRYIDNINGKAFICIKAGDSSVVSNTIEYFMPCNVVDNLGKLQNLTEQNISAYLNNSDLFADLKGSVKKIGRVVQIVIAGNLQPKTSNNGQSIIDVIPANFRPISRLRCVLLGANNSSLQSELDLETDGSIRILYSNEILTTPRYVQFSGMYFTD